MITEIKGNAVDYTLKSDDRILLHCCNAQGVMGSGIAKEVKEKIPSAYVRYLDSHRNVGSVSFSDDYNVANLVAQEFYGRDPNVVYVDYSALRSCLKIVSMVTSFRTEIVIPKYMCCGLAGGDWSVVLEMIEKYLSDFNITIVEL